MSDSNQGGDPTSMDYAVRAITSSNATGRNLNGYAILYGEPSRLLREMGREFTEVIQRGAFDDSIANSETDIKLYYNHQSDMPLARTSNGSLKIVSDSKGLRFSADIPETTLGNDVVTLLNNRTLTGEMSFGFFATRDKWSSDHKQRSVEQGKLVEISIVVDAAYPVTHSSLRSETQSEINLKRINSFRKKAGQ